MLVLLCAVDHRDPVAGATIDERFVGEPIEGFAQPGGSVHDHGLEGDDRRGPAFAGGVSGHFDLADHLHQPNWRSSKIVVEVPARIDRAAASASMASDLPLRRRERRSRACIHVCVRRVLYCCGWCESRPERRVCDAY